MTGKYAVLFIAGPSTVLSSKISVVESGKERQVWVTELDAVCNREAVFIRISTVFEHFLNSLIVTRKLQNKNECSFSPRAAADNFFRLKSTEYSRTGKSSERYDIDAVRYVRPCSTTGDLQQYSTVLYV